jgi:hypothetical protein
MKPPSEKSSENTGRDAAGTAQRVRWPGGYVRNGTFIIERKIGGRKFHVSTHTTTLRGAMKQLERFEEDPSAYDPRGSSGGDALVLDLQLIDEFTAWHRKSVSHEWSLDVRRLLIDWANHLRGADLRTLSLSQHLKSHLHPKPPAEPPAQQHHRVKAIRKLFGWLREERELITRAQDITLDLPVPVIKPRQRTGESKAVEEERVLKVLPLLAEHVRDVLEFLAITGWHISEVRRFAMTGTVRGRDAADKPEVLATVGTIHKDGGKPHFTALLFEPHVELAKRIRARGHVITKGRLRKHLLRACKQVEAKMRETDPSAKFKPFNMGDMRASVLTWLRIAGVPPELAMAYVGHTSIETQNRFYVNQQMTKAVLPRTALRLVR